MKKMVAMFVTVFVSSTVFAGATSKMQSYECSAQIRKALVKYANTSLAKDVKNLSEDLIDYSAQLDLADKTKKESEKQQILEAARASGQSINYSVDQIRSVSQADGDAIATACGLNPE